MNLSSKIQAYTKALSAGTGRQKARLLQDIKLDDRTIPKNTEADLCFEISKDTYHFESSSLGIAFAVKSHEIELF